MSAGIRYAASGVGACALMVLVLWPFLDPAGRTGVLLAAAIALPVQIAAFALLLRQRGELNGFLAVWVGGTLVRMMVLGIAAFAVIRSGMDGAIPMLLALPAFFFGLLLLEPVYFRPGPNTTVEA